MGVQNTETAPIAPTTLPADAAAPEVLDRHAVRRIRFSQALELHAQGWSARHIASAVGVNPQTVQGWLRSGELPTWQQQRHGCTVDHHANHLNRR